MNEGIEVGLGLPARLDHTHKAIETAETVDFVCVSDLRRVQRFA
jgi:hypothetical protein